MNEKEQRTANVGFGLWGLTCFVDTFVQGSTFVCMNSSAIIPPQRKAAARCKALSILLSLFFIFLGSAAQDAFRIKYLGSTEGLSNNSVRSIFQDSRGIMWFGTYDGLDRFDGYDFMVLRNRISDTTSLPHNYISAIAEDESRNLWVGMGQGAVQYNVATNVFIPVFYFPFQTTQKTKLSNYVNSILKDAYGNMIVATSSLGLIFRQKGTEVAIQVPVKNLDGSLNIYSSIQAIHIDSQNRLWVFVSGIGLHQFNYKTKKLEAVDVSIRNHSLNKMLTDSNGNLWLATSSGLYQYSLSTKAIVSGYTSQFGQLRAAYVTSLSLDKHGKLWIGTDGGGIDVLDTQTGIITNVDNQNRYNRLSANTILSIFIDKENRKWIGTNKGGINIIEESGNIFNTIRKGEAYPELSNNFITSFLEDSKKNLWIGTDGGGLNVWNTSQNKFKVYQPPTLSSNIISSLAQDSIGNIWVATFGGGVNKLDNSGKAKHYRLVNTDGYENKIAIRVYCDSRKNLWVTTYENGHLYKYNPLLDGFEAFEQQLGDLMSVFEDRQGILWAGSTFQLFRLDLTSHKHQVFEIGKTVRAIFEDTKGNFWIGSEGGGLILFDRKMGKIAARFTEDEGLSSNTVMNILEDKTGNLWISTSNGLNRFNPTTKRINCFYESDGLQDNQFSYRAALQLQSGLFAFGGNNGFNLFNPSTISSRAYFPKVVISSLRINNNHLSANNDYTVDENGEITQLTIPFSQAILSFQFAALEYSTPNKIKYSYYLEGWDKDWSPESSSRTVTYNNIREGSYTLRIKSTNAEGLWNTKETVVKIIVLPPWYRSWWAFLTYIIAFLGVIYAYLQYRTNRQRMKYELELSKLNEAMRKTELEAERMEKEVKQAELQKTHAEYEREKAERETERVTNDKEKEINQKRLSFFTNISHEFRTPLTMIINPVNDLIARYKDKDREDLRIIGLNASRILRLTDQLLLFRKIEEGADGLSISNFDFSQLISTVFLYFKHEAKTRTIDYTLKGNEDPITIYGDKNKIEIILYNLIANAFKYTPNSGSILVQLDKKSDRIIVQIKDTGSGIEEAVGAKIFERFYQAKEQMKSGFGIGLYLVKQFTQLHKGVITYQSKPGNGTCFNLELPLGSNHFQGMQIEAGRSNAQSTLVSFIDIEEELILPNLPEMPSLKTTKAIMVVDDDEEMRNYISSLFAEGYVVFRADNGAAALQLAVEKIPDLIISDVSMPVMDGIELCKAIKSNENINHIPVILLTAHTSQEIELKGTEEGADYYITKPFNKDLLIAKVNNIFKSRNNLQQFFYNKITLKADVTQEQSVPLEYKELLDKCITIVENHLDDPEFSIEKLAREMAMSHSYLYKRIKLISGQSVNAFIRFIRLRKAAEYLISTNDTVSDVAYKVGFSDVKYFREQFIKLFKMKPTDYIKQFRGKVVDRLRIDKG